MKECLETEKQAWITRQKGGLEEREAALREELKRERDRHIELVIRRLESEAATKEQAIENKINKNRCVTSIWATLRMSRSGTSLTANVEILGCKVCNDRSLRVRGSCQPRHKSVPPPACFDWRGWFRAGFSFFRGLYLRLEAAPTPNLTHPNYPATPEAVERSF
ncbi:hypothetical protein J6590_054469 [Homalodisca vitripennis]|nr:hypothetical protein J6590_054469 [Homalodisca vitripennis]